MSVNNDRDTFIEIKIDSLNLPKKSLEAILENIRVAKKRLANAENIILEAYKGQYTPSRDIPGEIGIFDGEYLVSKEGIKYEVPKSYSAKSLLIVGDELKKYTEDGQEKFKIVNKIPRKKVKGILSKKDGKYYVLLENNKSYILSKSAVEFRNLKQGDEVIVVISETENNSDYAAIDKLAPKPTPQTESKKSTDSKNNKNNKENNEIQENKDNQNNQEIVKDKTVTNIKPKIEFSDEDLL